MACTRPYYVPSQSLVGTRIFGQDHTPKFGLGLRQVQGVQLKLHDHLARKNRHTSTHYPKY